MWDGQNENMVELNSMAASVGALLKQSHQTVAVAESSAGGLISASLLAVAGASAYFLGGAVVYTGQARHALMGIDDSDMAGLRPSTEGYALLKARMIRESLGATWGLSETGATGPEGNRYGDAAGHGCVAVVGLCEGATTLETGESDRVSNMYAFAKMALGLLEKSLLESNL